ncbi:MAG: sensor histidine kinase [Chloroflexota bacterium]
MFHSIRWRIAALYVPLVLISTVLVAIFSANSLAIALMIGIATLLAVVLAVFVARGITVPIKNVIKASKSLPSGDLNEAVPTKSEDETGELAVTFNRMVQSLKERMDSLSDERSRLATALSGMADGVVMTDADGTVLLANPAAERLFEFEEDRAKGSPFIEVIPDYEISELLRSCIKERVQKAGQIERKSGQLFLRVVATPFRDDGVTGVLLLFQDLTEVRRLQVMKQEFVGNLSHELQTPLASVKAIVETLADGALEDKNATQKFLTAIDSEVDRMVQMVRELSELSRIETGRDRLDIAPVDLASVIDEVIAQLSPQAQRKGITLARQDAPGLPAVRADKDRLQRALANLIHNAIKFTPQDGRVAVSAEASEHGVTVSVADTGIGISRSDLPHVFNRFFKAEKSHSGEGTGLGLAIAKHIVQAHGGEIWVESEEGRGSVFRFSLPVE